MHSNRLNRFKRETFIAVQCTVIEAISHLIPLALIMCAAHNIIEMEISPLCVHYTVCT